MPNSLRCLLLAVCLMAPGVAMAQGHAGDTCSLTATASAAISTLVGCNAGGTAWPTSGYLPTSGFWIRNTGTIRLAVCLKGGTCTCAISGATAGVTTIGVAIDAGNAFGFSNFGNILYNTPTIVACSGTTLAEITQ